jgi:hypothetical protein
MIIISFLAIILLILPGLYYHPIFPKCPNLPFTILLINWTPDNLIPIILCIYPILDQ